MTQKKGKLNKTNCVVKEIFTKFFVVTLPFQIWSLPYGCISYNNMLFLNPGYYLWCSDNLPLMYCNPIPVNQKNI